MATRLKLPPVRFLNSLVAQLVTCHLDTESCFATLTKNWMFAVAGSCVLWSEMLLLRFKIWTYLSVGDQTIKKKDWLPRSLEKFPPKLLRALGGVCWQSYLQFFLNTLFYSFHRTVFAWLGPTRGFQVIFISSAFCETVVCGLFGEKRQWRIKLKWSFHTSVFRACGLVFFFWVPSVNSAAGR